MITVTIQATQEELLALRQLLHRAVLHSGMQAAEAAVHWHNKLNMAEQASMQVSVQAPPPDPSRSTTAPPTPMRGFRNAFNEQEAAQSDGDGCPRP
jgi:hypothetical protein